MKIDKYNGSVALDLHFKKCRTCGKEFECSTNHAYKRPFGRYKQHFFCSYKCLREYDRSRE